MKVDSMSVSHPYDEVLTWALQLPPHEKLQLIEQVAHSIKPNITPQAVPADHHWGKSLNQLLDTLDTSDWEAMDMEDVVEWVRNLREREADKFRAYWDGEK
jgi:formate dehydrogenase maturation protein FdhE